MNDSLYRELTEQAGRGRLPKSAALAVLSALETDPDFVTKVLRDPKGWALFLQTGRQVKPSRWESTLRGLSGEAGHKLLRVYYLTLTGPLVDGGFWEFIGLDGNFMKTEGLWAVPVGTAFIAITTFVVYLRGPGGNVLRALAASGAYVLALSLFCWLPGLVIVLLSHAKEAMHRRRARAIAERALEVTGCPNAERMALLHGYETALEEARLRRSAEGKSAASTGRPCGLLGWAKRVGWSKLVVLAGAMLWGAGFALPWVSLYGEGLSGVRLGGLAWMVFALSLLLIVYTVLWILRPGPMFRHAHYVIVADSVMGVLIVLSGQCWATRLNEIPPSSFLVLREFSLQYGLIIVLAGAVVASLAAVVGCPRPSVET